MKALLPFLKLFRHQWAMMVLGLALSVTTLLAGIGLLSLSGWFLSSAAVAGLIPATARAFNYFTPGAGVRSLSMARTLSRYAERLATHEATFRLLTRLRVWAWRRILPLSAKNMQGLRQGELLNRLVADIDTLDHLYLRLVIPVSAAMIMLCLLFAFTAFIDLKLAVILCASLMVIWLVLPWGFYLMGRSPGISQLEHKRVLRVRILEFVQGLAEISLFGATERFRAGLARSEARLLSSQRAMATVAALSQAALVLCHGLLVTGMLWAAADGVGDHQPPGPMLAMMAFMALACIEMLMPAAAAFQHLSACINAARRVNDLACQEPAVLFSRRNSPAVTRGELALSGVAFAYPGGGLKVLKGIDLSLDPGEKTALVGKTGCGKSTLISLITREWEPDGGRILLDGAEINRYSRKALTSGISVVSQRVYLFSGTLRENLAMALPEGHRNRSKADRKQLDLQLIHVLEQVGLSALTRSADCLDTWIGEGGRQLSGGERRRIGVARVLLRDAPLLLLDEPTEGLDKGTEREILDLLFDFAENKTVLMISHRLTAMARMDAIHLMENGRIRVSGTHAQLLADDAYYASLHEQLQQVPVSTLK
ncbi:MAG TPA: cysteine/glutathione ABC transporter ATP-binding protein/permease CydC [Desulfobacteraceae bacterium]|nr:cysteine/glutathione ABC transporter ATP-binding protein/permease CydC [Desulfobacteraceae bacterium]